MSGTIRRSMAIPASLALLSAFACVGNLALEQVVREERERRERADSRRMGVNLPSNVLNGFLLDWWNRRPRSGSDAPTPDIYRLTESEKIELDHAITLGEARGEFNPEIRQFQARELKKMEEYINSDEFHDISADIGYPPGYEPGMKTLGEVQRGYTAELSRIVESADDPELLDLHRRAINFQMFSIQDMLEKAKISELTVSREFLESSLDDLAEVRRQIVNRERALAAAKEANNE